MKVKASLEALSKFYGVEAPSAKTASPLDSVKDQLISDYEQREASRLEAAEDRAAFVGKGPILDIAKRIARGLASEDLAAENRDIPCVLSFDAYGIVRDAATVSPKDRGIKLASQILYRKWAEDVEGSLTLSDLDRVKNRVALDHPNSKAASIIDNAVSRVGFNTLKELPKLARIASEVTDQASYEAAVEAYGLANHPRARGFIRSLVGMVAEGDVVVAGCSPQVSSSETAGRSAILASRSGRPSNIAANTERVLDRTLLWVGAGDDPAFRYVGQMSPPDAPEPSVTGLPSNGANMPDGSEGMSPHEEEGETSATIESPITGDPLVVELSEERSPMDSVEPSMPPSEKGGPMLGSDKVDKMEYMGRLSELARIAQADTPIPPEGQLMPGEGMPPPDETKTIIRDPSGADLELTLRPVEEAEEEPTPEGSMSKGLGGETGINHGIDPQAPIAAYASVDVKADHEVSADHEMCAEHDMARSECAHMHKDAKAPPGAKYEREVHHIKDEDTYPSKKKQKEVAYATAWRDYNKDHSKKKKSFAIYAVVDGESANEPIDHAHGDNIFAAFNRLAGFGVDGDVLMDPQDASAAIVVLNAERGDHLQVIAVKPGKDPYEVTVNEQQPDQMAIPEDGGKALKSDGGEANLRATRKISKFTAGQIRQAAKEIGIDRSDVEAQVLAGNTVTLADWQIKLASIDTIEYGLAGSNQRKQSLLEMDEALSNFEAGVVESTLEKIAAFTPVLEEIFAYRCASCKEVSEYVMPKTAEPLTCGHCRSEQSVGAVAAAFARLAESHKPDYLISVPWPKGRDARDAAINAKRILTEVKKVTAAELIDPEENNLRLVVRKADKPALARIQKVLRGVFGVPTLSIEAQVGDTGATLPVPEAKPVSGPPAVGQADQASPFQGQTPMPQTPAGQPMAPMSQPMQTSQTGTTAQQTFIAEHTSPLDKNKAKMPMLAAMESNFDVVVSEPLVMRGGQRVTIQIRSPARQVVPEELESRLKAIGEKYPKISEGAFAEIPFKTGVYTGFIQNIDRTYPILGNVRAGTNLASFEVVTPKLKAGKLESQRLVSDLVGQLNSILPKQASRKAQMPPADMAGPGVAGLPGSLDGAGPTGPGMGPGMGEPTGQEPALMGMQPSEALGQIPNEPQMAPGTPMGQGMDETGKEAAYAAVMHYRNQGMGVLDALAEFRRQYGDYIDGLGDEATPERHMAEAEIVRIAGEVYEKPALIQRAAAMVENALRIFGSIFEDKTANSRNDAPGKGLEPKKINTQQPDWVPKKKVKLERDHEKDEMPAPKSVPTQHPPHGVNLTPNPSNLGPDGDSREPNFHNPKPAPGGQGGSQHPQRGESWANTDLGKDSETNMKGEISKAMDAANAAAPDALRSK